MLVPVSKGQRIQGFMWQLEDCGPYPNNTHNRPFWEAEMPLVFPQTIEYAKNFQAAAEYGKHRFWGSEYRIWFQVAHVYDL